MRYACWNTIICICIKSSKTILYGRNATLRVRDKWLIFNIVSQLWADVKYHVPTGVGFSPKASGFYPFGDATALLRGRWQKAVFYVFVSVPQYFSTEPKAADNHHDYRLPIVPPQGIEP